MSLELSTLGAAATVSHATRSDDTHVFSFSDTGAELSACPCPDGSFTLSVSAPRDADLVQADFDLGGASWFGFGHLMNQLWPLNAAALHLTPAFAFDNGPTGLCTVLDLSFVTSSGGRMVVDDDGHTTPGLHVAVNSPVPLHSELTTPHVWTVGLDALHMNREVLPRITEIAHPRTLTLQSRREYDHQHLSHPWSGHAHGRDPALSFTLSAAESPNAKQALLQSLQHMRETVGRAPCGEAKLKMMQAPIWSTWVQF